jgi:hypothetical protein
MMTDELRRLGEAFALLRGELMQLDIEGESKQRAIQRVALAEDESAREKPDPESIVHDLAAAKKEVESSGKPIDIESGWGKRLVEVGKALKEIIPTVAPLIGPILGAVVR